MNPNVEEFKARLKKIIEDEKLRSDQWKKEESTNPDIPIDTKYDIKAVLSKVDNSVISQLKQILRKCDEVDVKDPVTGKVNVTLNDLEGLLDYITTIKNRTDKVFQDLTLQKQNKWQTIREPQVKKPYKKRKRKIIKKKVITEKPSSVHEDVSSFLPSSPSPEHSQEQNEHLDKAEIGPNNLDEQTAKVVLLTDNAQIRDSMQVDFEEQTILTKTESSNTQIHDSKYNLVEQAVKFPSEISGKLDSLSLQVDFEEQQIPNKKEPSNIQVHDFGENFVEQAEKLPGEISGKLDTLLQVDFKEQKIQNNKESVNIQEKEEDEMVPSTVYLSSSPSQEETKPSIDQKQKTNLSEHSGNIKTAKILGHKEVGALINQKEEQIKKALKTSLASSQSTATSELISVLPKDFDQPVKFHQQYKSTKLTTKLSLANVKERDLTLMEDYEKIVKDWEYSKNNLLHELMIYCRMVDEALCKIEKMKMETAVE